VKNSGIICSVEDTGAAPVRDESNPTPRILLVDDDFYIRELNAGVLIRFGYKVDTAADGADAWKALNEQSYDLLITDNRMPRVTGLELIKKLRSEDMTLPVILASGTLPVRELKLHPWLQLDATLPKPFTIAELLDTVKKVLQAADSARIRVEKDFPVIMQAISEIESESPPQAIMQNGEIAPAIAPARDQLNSTPRILVVDDESDSRQLTVDVLTRSGYEVEAVKDGAAGWEALQDGDFDLIITDNKMPRMTGVEMLEKLRSARMALPVIMATGLLPAHEFVRKPWLKPDVTLEKPFSNDELLAAVKKILGATDGIFNNPQLFRDCAMEGDKIPQARESAVAPIRDQTNLHQRILVVDDDRDSRQLSVDVLIGSGYDVEGANDGAAGWEALQNNSYDLVITDNKMPRMTGIEMIGKLRSARMTLPVIMATRYLPTHEFVLRPWLKPDAALERPFSNDDLLATVKKILHTDEGDGGHSGTLLPKYL
jgi:DNA-binding response OmpR family regulator